MCLASQILISLRLFGYSLVWEGHYFWMLKRSKKFCMCKGWDLDHLKYWRQPFQKHLSLWVLFQDVPVYVHWWLDTVTDTASLQLCHYIQTTVHVNGMHPREARWDGGAMLDSALGLILLVTQLVQWDAWRHKVFLVWRGP